MGNKTNPGGRPRKLTPIEEIGVYNMYRQGKPLAEIAYLNNISVSTVQRIVNKNKGVAKDE